MDLGSGDGITGLLFSLLGTSFLKALVMQLDSWNEKMVNVQRSTGLDEKSSEVSWGSHTFEPNIVMGSWWGCVEWLFNPYAGCLHQSF